MISRYSPAGQAGYGALSFCGIWWACGFVGIEFIGRAVEGHSNVSCKMLRYAWIGRKAKEHHSRYQFLPASQISEAKHPAAETAGCFFDRYIGHEIAL